MLNVELYVCVEMRIEGIEKEKEVFNRLDGNIFIEFPPSESHHCRLCTEDDPFNYGFRFNHHSEIYSNIRTQIHPVSGTHTQQ